KVRRAHVLSSFFTLLRVKPFLGRALVAEDDAVRESRGAVLSYALWQRRFGGDSGVLGRTITLDTYGRRDYTVVGVMPPGFALPDQCELWLAAGWNGIPADRRSGRWLNVLARLKPGVTLERARAE